MPVAIIVLEGQLPAIIQERTNAELINRLNELTDAPHMEDVSAARNWLQSLPFPSGWFLNAEIAKMHVRQGARPATMSPVELTTIRESLHLSRADFAERIGYKGNPNTRHKQIFELEQGIKPIMPEKARAARALFTENAVH